MKHSPPITGLPVEEILPQLVATLDTENCAVLQAPPGAGKTTTVPLWLLGLKDLGPKKILMLEPRRLAARAAARRMADLLGEAVGETVGYRIRLENKVSKKTRIEVVTEGILTRFLQEDPELSNVGVIIFDEFHERNLNTDLGLALARQTQEILREDLKILVMSATLDAEGVSQLLDDAPILTSLGRQYPVETHHISRTPKGRFEGVLVSWIEEIVQENKEGDILVFLPGAGEINRTLTGLTSFAKNNNISLLPLFGNLSQKDQDKALNPDPDGRRKIVFSTDIAETSLTIDGVHIVIDCGLSRKPYFDPNSGMSRLEMKRISRASADQRQGRAGRLGPGICYRMWSAAEDRGLVPHSQPEIATADLNPLVLELAKWGVEDETELSWLTPPPSGLVAQAKDLLIKLGALDSLGKITKLGEKMVRLPLHPRLARMIIKSREIGKGGLACDLAALLSERDILRRNPDAPNSDIATRVELLNVSRKNRSSRPEHRRLLQSADDLRRRFKIDKGMLDTGSTGSVLALAYPDRIGELRKKGKSSYRLSGGRGALLHENDKLAGEPYLVVADLDGKGRDARVYLAAAISYAQILDEFSDQITVGTRVVWDDDKERVIADEETCLGALVLNAKRIKNPSPDDIVAALITAIRDREMRPLPWEAASLAVIDRVAFAKAYDQGYSDWPELSKSWLLENMEKWLTPYLTGKNSLAQLQSLKLEEILLTLLSWEGQQRLGQIAPAKMSVPTGSKIRLDYSDVDAPVLAVRLQELFGQADIPALAGGRVPISIHLLSPARRPAQITKDLAGFWKNSYTAVKKDLKGQYPRHYWPDDPLQAEPTARAKPRGK
ncbi:ATP-dependent helicase HrpB [Alphaproteobacteria bacterium 46_93_T64]|nr:ATP-dependent helicase HrpB [Alphaproteobacteria bacterium 46_93_T64]